MLQWIWGAHIFLSWFSSDKIPEVELLYNMIVLLFFFLIFWRNFILFSTGFPGFSEGKESACNAGDQGSIPGSGWEVPIEKRMATHSSILAWRIPGTEEPGGLWSMWSQRVGHNWVTNTFTFILFSIVATATYIPTSTAQGFPFGHILANACYFLSF